MFLEDKIKDNQSQFRLKVYDIAEKLGIDPDWLMGVMFIESSLDHRAVNKITNATGLIQFMPYTATRLGTTTQNLLGMSNVEQLDYVYNYLKPWANKLTSLIDLYLTIFFPAGVAKPEDWVVQASTLPASLIAKQNPGYDLNRDGQITLHEIEVMILTILHNQNPSPGEWYNLKKKVTWTAS